MKINFILNGNDISIEAPPTLRVSTLLREELGILSLKTGCNRGQCGSCTLLKDKKPVPACLLPAFAIKGSEIMTIEGFKNFKEYKEMNETAARLHVELCDYCKGARFLSVFSFCETVKNTRVVSDEAIIEALSGTRCSCTDLWSLVDFVRAILETRNQKTYGFKQ